MRILVVGMQTGEAGEHITMESRAEQVRRAAAHEDDYYSSHMRGTAAALEVLFGVARGSEHVIVDGADRHIFECFAMANATLCSLTATTNRSYADHASREAQKRSGSPADDMYRNCRPHLKATIAALEPTIVLCEGRAKRGETPSSSLCAVASKWRALNDDGSLVDASVSGHRFIGVLAAHPTARGKRLWPGAQYPYFAGTVAPLLERARIAARDLAANPNSDDTTVE